jgi:hypothetical protein
LKSGAAAVAVAPAPSAQIIESHRDARRQVQIARPCYCQFAIGRGSLVSRDIHGMHEIIPRTRERNPLKNPFANNPRARTARATTV